MAFVSVENLSKFKAKLEPTIGSKLGVSGTSISLKDKGGNVLSTVTVDVPTYADATTNKSGLMSASDKTKLDGVASGATKVQSSTNGKLLINGTSTTVYQHPTYTAQDQGFYLVQIDGSGHVIATTPVSKSDIVALGIPAQDTTYTAATTSKAGLMSAADKTKVNSVASGAQVNVLESVKVNGTALTVTSRGVNIDLTPYALKSDISQAVKYKGSVAKYADLPTSAKAGDMYNVQTADASHGISAGENVIFDGTGWDALGSVFAIQEATDDQIDALFD